MNYKIAIFAFLTIISCTSKNDKEQKSEIIILSERIAQNPSDVNLLYERVRYNQLKGNFESALYDLNEIISLDSSNFENHLNIAKLYLDLSRDGSSNYKYPSLVKAHVKKAIEINEECFEAYAINGELLLAYFNFEEAIENFNTSLAINYNQEKTHMLMGYAFKQLKRYDNAINCFRNAVNIDPDFFEAHVQLGQTFHLLGDTNAISYYNNALNINPDDELTLYNKALFFQSKLDWNNALESYASLHRISPFHSSGHYNIGFIHMELGLYDIATNNFSDAIYSNSEFYEAYYSRGICFETLGNIKQAESDYTRAIEIKPDYEFAIEALNNLRNNNIIYN